MKSINLYLDLILIVKSKLIFNSKGELISKSRLSVE